MPAAWPGTLPQEVLADGFMLGTGDGRLRTPTSTGPGKVRRRSSATARPLSCRIRIDAAQKAILEDFVADDLQGGALPFTFPNPVGGPDLLVRFAESLPAYVNQGGDLWMASLDLEVLP